MTCSAARVQILLHLTTGAPMEHHYIGPLAASHTGTRTWHIPRRGVMAHAEDLVLNLSG